MTRQKTLEMANFICHFGKDLTLLDLASDVILPAYLDNNVTRRYGDDTTFLFHDVRLRDLSAGNRKTLCICGRLVKDTILKREQVFQGGTILQDEKTLPSAPSALFVLLLNNHRLLYLRETSFAPSLEQFKATSLFFIKRKHRDYISRLYQEGLSKGHTTPEGDKLSKKYLCSKYPMPTLEIVPLASDESFQTFIRRYSVLQRVEITMLKPNQEFDADRFFRDVRRQQHAFGSDNTKLLHQNKEGLQALEASKQLQLIAGQGNHDIQLSGIDLEGEKLKGNNDNFKLMIPLPKVPLAPSDAAEVLHDKYTNLVRRGSVTSPQISDEVERTIEELRERYK